MQQRKIGIISSKTVKEYAPPLLILTPMTPVLLVYDIEDIEDKNKPKLIEDVYKVSGEINLSVSKKY